MAKEYAVTVKKNDDSTVTIEGTISWDAFMSFEQEALTRLGAHLELDGFRKGKVPEDVAKKHLGDELLLTDMAELAMLEFYPSMLKEENIDAIGRPALTITKLARGNELGFTLRTAVLPSIDLPDYKKIASGIAETTPSEVTEEDVDKVVENLRQMRAYGHVHHDDMHDHKHEEPLPEVNDEFAASFGAFKTVAELRAKVRENVGKEKVHEAGDKRRAAILDAVLEKTTVTIPEIITMSEQDKMYSQIEMDISRSGLSMDDYLKHASKTKEQVLAELRPDAEKRAKMQLIVNAIAKKENLVATDKEVEERTGALTAMHPDVEKSRLAAYADMVITNEKVIDFLEKGK